MMTDRANAICLLEILREYSDAEHILPMRELISKMNTIYGLKPDRRTLYSAVSLLIDLGYEISTFEENGKGYYIHSRDFEQSEILLLCDAVYSFPFLPAKQSEQLIAKLQKQLSVHKRKEHRNLTIVRQDQKTKNRQVFWNIEQLDEAISRKCRVRFRYLKYSMEKQLIPRRDEPYTVEPYRMVYMNEHYYLICKAEDRDYSAFYRLDRMRDIELLPDQPVQGQMDSQAVTNAVYAFAGRPEKVALYCKNCVLDDVLDKFGTEVQIYPRDEKTFCAAFTAPPSGIKFWALQYLPYVEVSEPQWLREEVLAAIRENPYQVSQPMA